MSGRGRGGRGRGGYGGAPARGGSLHTGGRGRGRGGRGGGGRGRGSLLRDSELSREEKEAELERQEELLGYEALAEGEQRLGYLMNMSQARSRSKVFLAFKLTRATAGLPRARGDGADAVLRELLLHVPGAQLRCLRAPFLSSRRSKPLVLALTLAPREQDGTTFKAQVVFAPYFLLAAKARRGCRGVRPSFADSWAPARPAERHGAGG